MRFSNNRHASHTKSQKAYQADDPSRRTVVQRGLGAMAAGVALGQAPFGFAKTRPSLRVLGTHVTLQEPLRLQAQQDLGIDITFEPGGSAAVLLKASSRPRSFDLYEQWSNSINVLWQADAIQPIDRNRIQLWGEINNLTKTGRITPEAKLGLGDAPYKLLYVQDDLTLGSTESNHISFLPYVHNVDSFGYNTKQIPEGIPYQTESWGWLLDPKHKGKVALVNAPTIGIFDAALAAEAQGLMSFKNMGNMTKPEVDTLFAILIAKKREGHFSGFWSSVPQSVEFMAKGRVTIESMFSPAVSALNGQGVPVTYAAPREGYRAWHGVMCLSSATEGAAKDAAYDYMNWWLSGWPGAFIARQGYYISIPDRAREHLEEDEWAYWYDGRPATRPLKGTDGKVSVQPGTVRTGGSYTQRFENVAVWNTVMDTYEYSLQRWYELLST